MGTYQLHLMLDSNELVVHVGASICAVGKLGDELAARDVLGSIFGNLVGPTCVDTRLWLRKDHGLHAELGRSRDDVVVLAADVAAMVLSIASQLWRVEGGVSTGEGARRRVPSGR